MEGTLSLVANIYLLSCYCVITSFGEILFGPLEKASDKREYIGKGLLQKLTEDQYNPGLFYGTLLSGVYNYTDAAGLQLYAGEEMLPGYQDGDLSIAKFSYLYDVLRMNRSTLLIADTTSSCIRTINTETRTAYTLAGNCTMTFTERIKDITVGMKFPYKSHSVGAGIFELSYLEEHNYILFFDMVGKFLYMMDMDTETVTAAISAAQLKLEGITMKLVTSDERFLYVLHPHGITRVDLYDMSSELVFGKNITGSLSENLPYLKEGIGKSAQFSDIGNFRWLEPDLKFLAVGIGRAEGILYFDLEMEKMSVFCNGSTTENNRTKTGTLDECSLNLPKDFCLTHDNHIYLVAMENTEIESLVPTSPIAMYKMKLEVPGCTFKAPTGVEVAVPYKTVYPRNTLIEVDCPLGYGIDSKLGKVRCDGGEWNPEIPKCSPKLELHSVTPSQGQKAGGTRVTVEGVIPIDGIKIEVHGGNKQVAITEFQVRFSILKFKMPSWPKAENVQIKITLAKPEQKSYLKEFTYRYLQNPELESYRLVNTQSGGLQAEFTMRNRESVHKYSMAPRHLYRECEKKSTNQVICYFPSMLPGLLTPQSSKSFKFVVGIYGDGKLIADDLPVTLLDDPVFDNFNKSQLVVEGDELSIDGENLDLDYNNRNYEVYIIEMSENNRSVPCEVTNITETRLSCRVPKNGVAKYGSLHALKVRIGHFSQEIGTVQVSQMPLTEGELQEAILTGVLLPIVIVVSLCLLLIIAILAYILYRKRNQKKFSLDSITIKDDSAAKNTEVLFQLYKELMIGVENIKIDEDQLVTNMSEEIGQGHFGTIYLGKLMRDDNVTIVAVKTLRDYAPSVSSMAKFLEEAVFLQDYHHANVLETIGVCWPDGKMPLVVMPYMVNGDLKSFILNKNLTLTLGDLLHFGMQIASGMSYLTSHKFVHRDLAARNCLVSDKYIVKISDFGLSKDVYNKDYYKPTAEGGTPLPVKWMSIESLKTSVFTSQSDVWSYGVLLWELCTRGAEPYPDINTWDIKEYISLGYRLNCPELCPPEIFEKMQLCWQEDPTLRPSFDELHNFLSTALKNTMLAPTSGYSYVRDVTKEISDDYVTTESSITANITSSDYSTDDLPEPDEIRQNNDIESA